MPTATKRPLFKFGPGALVTAAFIGPGTITTCSLAGARFGYALLWGMIFSVIATIVLQEMAARLGIITRMGLGEALRRQFTAPAAKIITAILVISAITLGNAAFETGNILGASIGMQSLFVAHDLPVRLWAVLTGVAALILLMAGSYKLIERALIGLVIIMSLTFVTTAVIISPHLPDLLRGMFIPSVPRGSALTLVGLIGTTVVPYNLFLHASAVQERWSDAADMPAARTDISVSVILGGLISMAIIVTAAVAFFGSGTSVTGAADLARQLEPLMGQWAKYVISIGLFAAGISSAITAPLAAAYATAGIMGWKRDMRSWRFRLVWMVILLTGILFASIGFSPLEAILFAQAANGILLPVIAIYLLMVMNNSKIMGDHVNRLLSNILGAIVVLTALVLGMRSIMHVAGII
jgi:manganese transport protein